MIGRLQPSHLVLWAAVFALLMNAAAPFLAMGAAQARGVPLADVCSVYGVRLPGALPVPRVVDANRVVPFLGHKGGDPHPDKAHSVDHCALTALGAFAMPDAASPSVLQVDSVPAGIPVQCSRDVDDAATRWATRLHHGPPLFA